MSYEESVFLGGVPGEGGESVVDVPAGGWTQRKGGVIIRVVGFSIS